MSARLDGITDMLNLLFSIQHIIYVHMLTFIVSPLGNLLFAISCYCTDVQAIIQALKKICSTHMHCRETSCFDCFNRRKSIKILLVSVRIKRGKKQVRNNFRFTSISGMMNLFATKKALVRYLTLNNLIVKHTF